MNGTDGPIGVFDSGMGGLTVLSALRHRLPNEQFLYLGDTARLPYGTKSADTVRRYAVQAAAALIARKVKLIVIACNTASIALPAIEEAVAPIPVNGVVLPGVEAALAVAPQGPIAVLATEGTVKGGVYPRAIQARANVDVVQRACPLFVPLAEEGIVDGPLTEEIARLYLDPLLMLLPRPKCLLLGCTHYPALKTAIARVAGEGVSLVDSATPTADSVARVLEQRNFARISGPPPRDMFFATDAPDRFARVGEIFLGHPIDPGDVELVDLA